MKQSLPLTEAREIILVLTENVSALKQQSETESTIKNNLYAFLIQKGLMDEFRKFLGTDPAHSPNPHTRAAKEFALKLMEEDTKLS